MENGARALLREHWERSEYLESLHKSVSVWTLVFVSFACASGLTFTDNKQMFCQLSKSSTTHFNSALFYQVVSRSNVRLIFQIGTSSKRFVDNVSIFSKLLSTSKKAKNQSANL